MYFSLRLVLKALELTYHTPPAQQILQPLILLWTEQRAAHILQTFLLRCSLHGLICTWNKPLKNETRRERKKETLEENERSLLNYRWLDWTASIEFLFLVLTLSISRQKILTGNGQPHFFFFSIFILSPCCQRDTLLYVHVAFRWERKSPSSRPCHCSQIIRTAITVYNVQLYRDKLLLVGSCLVTLISICMSHMMKNQTKQAGWVITNSVKKKW